MLTKEQVAERTQYIGGSDAAAVLGLSRWKTPIQVWAEKTGQLPPEDISNRLEVKMGNKLEDAVAELFTEETGKAVRRCNRTLFHPKFPFLAANLDREVVGEDAILEAKTTKAWALRDWEEEQVPAEYILQVMHYLAVTGKKRGYVACLFGGSEAFKWKVVERDEKLIAEIVAAEVHFWNTFVVPRVMPSHVTKNDQDVLYRLFPRQEPGEQVQLGEDANQLADNIKAMQQDYSNLGGMIDAEKNKLRAMLQKAECGITDRWKITWKEQVANRLDTDRLMMDEPLTYSKYVKPVPSRVLRITPLKK